jgi:hypothetical protein
MVGTLYVGPQVTGQVHDGVIVWNGTAGVETEQVAATALRGRVQMLGQINDPQISKLTDRIHIQTLLTEN